MSYRSAFECIDLKVRSHFKNHTQSPVFILLIELGLYDTCLTSILTWIEMFFIGSLNVNRYVRPIMLNKIYETKIAFLI